MKSIIYWIGSALLIVLIVFGVELNRTKKQLEQTYQNNNLLEASKDSLKLVFNKKTNEWQYEKKALQANNETLTSYLDKNNKELADLKKKNKAVVGIVSDIKIGVDTIVKNDTTYIDSSKNQIRIAEIKNEYYQASIKSYKDSMNLSLKMFAKQSYALNDKGKLIIKSNNPYIDYSSVDAFYVTSPKQKSKNWKYVIGFGLGSLITYKLIK